MNAMDVIEWWEIEKLLTPKDKEAIAKARSLPWEDISEDWAETELGRREIHSIIMDKYHRDEGEGY